MSAECPMCSLTFSLSNIERHASVCGLGALVGSPQPTFSKTVAGISTAGSVGSSLKAEADVSRNSPGFRGKTLFGTNKRRQDDNIKERH